MEVLSLPFDGQVEVYNSKEAVSKIVNICNNSTTTVKGKRENKKTFYNVAMTFDIETTKVLNEFWEKGVSEMYKYFSYPFCWQAYFGNAEDGFFIFGRDPKDFFTMLDNVSKKVEGHIPSFIHNMAYEYNNLKDHFHKRKDTSVFMRNKSTPLAIEYGNFRFTCTAQLTHKSLDQLGKEIGYEKLKGKFDYNKQRHLDTPVTAEEINYCYRDVKVLFDYIKKTVLAYKKKFAPCRLPLTQTGYIRDLLKERWVYSPLGRQVNAECALTSAEYDFIRKAFFGAYVGANPNILGKELKGAMHIDLCSAYPAVMALREFPFKIRRVYNNDLELFLKKLDKDGLAIIADIRFDGVTLRKGHTPIMSYNPALDGTKYASIEAIEENGRLVCAESFRVTLTDVDIRLFLDNYEVENIYIYCYYEGTKKPLPFPIINIIFELFEKKSTLKGVERMEDELRLSKEKFNALYGLCAQSLYQDSYEVGSNLYVESKGAEYQEDFILPPVWALYITAYVREIICGMITDISELGKNLFYYSDTDSIFCKDTPQIRALVDEYNDDVKAMLEMLKDTFPNAMPCNSKGEVQYLGSLAEEDDVKGATFCTIGAKRYYIKKGNIVTVTFSGLTATKPEDGKNGRNTQRLIDKFGSIHKAFTAIMNGEDVTLEYQEGDRLGYYNTVAPYSGYIDDGITKQRVSRPCSYTLYEMDTKFTLADSLNYILKVFAGIVSNDKVMGIFG